jgi:hypothetical protein
MVSLAHDLADQRGEMLLVAGEVELRCEYDDAPSELQRAMVIAADAAQVANDLGSTSPQAKLIRELYAANAAVAALDGVRVPYLEPLVTALGGEHTGQCARLEEFFHPRRIRAAC